MIIRYERDDELYHHGIRGMHWNIRRFQNEDGSYTAAGRARYGIGQAKKALATAGVVAGVNAGIAGRKVYEGVNKAVGKAKTAAYKAYTTPIDNGESWKDFVDENRRYLRDNGKKAYAKEVAKEVAKDAVDLGAFVGNRFALGAASWVNPRYSKRIDSLRLDPKNAEKIRNTYTWKQYAQDMKDSGRDVVNGAKTAALYANGAKNLAGNYARYAKDAIGDSKAAQTARVMGMAGKQIAGITGRDLANRARNAATTADVYGTVLKNGLKARAQGIAEGAKSAATTANVYGTVLKNGLKARGPEVAEGAKKYAGAMGEIMKAYGKEIGGNANSAALRAGLYMNKAKDAAGAAAKDAAQTARVMSMAGKQIAGMAGRDFMNLAKKRGTGDPGEDREKLDPNARSGYDRRLANALGWANGRRQAAAQAETDARAKHDEAVRTGVRSDIAKYQKQMMDDAKATSKVNGDRASFYLTRSGYGGELPYKLTFGKDTVTSNPLKAAYDYNNERSRLTNVAGRMDEKLSDKARAQKPTEHRLQFGDDVYKYDPSKSALKTIYDKKGSDDDRLAAYTEYLRNNSDHSSGSSNSAVKRMAKLEDEMNAFRDNRARANLASKDAVSDMLMRSNPNAQARGEHTDYFGTNARQRNEINARTNWTIENERQKRQDSERQYDEARRYAFGQTSQSSRDAGYINRDAFSRKLHELIDKEDAEERRTTKIPPWIAEKYGTSKDDIPSYLWDALKKRR